jgi:hypothetical protein
MAAMKWSRSSRANGAGPRSRSSRVAGEEPYIAAKTDYIGRANRWLNPAGIADFDGDGIKEIAFIQTPHIGGTLFFYREEDGEMNRLARFAGVSNHAIGSPRWICRWSSIWMRMARLN